MGTGGVPGCIFCCGRFGWLTGCSGVGAGVGSEGASSGSAGLVAIVCVWGGCGYA